MDTKGPDQSSSRHEMVTKTKKLTRKQILEKKSAMEEAIRKAAAVKDHLSPFPALCRYEANGLSVYLESGHGDKLSTPTRKYIQNLLKVNMAGPYGAEWPSEEKVKRREMVAPEARYIFVRPCPDATVDERFLNPDDGATKSDGDRLLGFVHYRFTIEEELPVVYVYELQLEPVAKGKGLGNFLMQLIELIAQKTQMAAVVLTVLKSNVASMTFYTNKLRYVVSSISPSRVHPLIGAEKSYEILCKTFDPEAKAILEEPC